MIKILSIADPILKTYQTNALPLSIIMTSDNAKNYIYNEFIQLQCINVDYAFEREIFTNSLHVNFFKKNTEYYDKEYYPLDSILTSSPEQLFYLGNFQTIKNFIDNNYYIYTLADKYYIEGTQFYKQLHADHDFLINGYDTSNEYIYILTYINTKLKQTCIPFSEFKKAYFSNIYDVYEHRGRATFYKLSNRIINIDLEKIKWFLFDYIQSSDTERRLVTQSYTRDLCYYWGLNIYDEMINFYKNYIQRGFIINTNDIYCLYEHKYLMFLRMKYLNDNSYISISSELLENLDNLHKKAYELIYLSMKINVHSNLKDWKKVTLKLQGFLYKLKTIHLDDEMILNRIIEQNKKIFIGI